MQIKNKPAVSDYQFIAQLKNLPFVKRVILFGSRARGSGQTRSDIDLAIDCPSASPRQWQEVLTIVEHADTLLLIDCVRFDTVDGELREQIIKDGINL